MILLAGDIGGTHTRLALTDGPDRRLCHVQRYENAGARSLEELVSAFLDSRASRPERACFAVAGPTNGRRARLTNLDWRIDAASLSERFKCSVTLINDFTAVGHGIDALQAADLHTLQAGSAVPRAPRLAVGAGTGLGVVQCVHGPDGYRPLPSEGGHIAFAPVDEAQAALLRSVQTEFGRTSVERILSGPGIVSIYKHCRLAMGRQQLQTRSAAEITAAALAGDDAAAVWAMQLFSAIFGQTAGDLALVTRPEAGVYLAGGIAAKIVPLLDDGRFMAGFHAKGRFSDWMATLPVHIVLDPDIGLKGAALAA